MELLQFLVLLFVCCLNGVWSYQVATPDPNNLYDKCEYGRHLKNRCAGLTPDPRDSMCPDGFFCYTPADGEGPCCLIKNPCNQGVPYKVNDDAVTCSKRNRCPTGHVCSTGDNFAVCCPAYRFCPSLASCPSVSPPRCARPTTFRYKSGLICPGCDKNTCKRKRGCIIKCI